MRQKKIISILFFLLLINFVVAEIDDINITYDSTDNTAQLFGFHFVANKNITTISVSKDGADASTQARIYSGVQVLIEQAMFVGNNATFNSNLTLYGGFSYYIQSNAAGANRDVRRKLNADSYPRGLNNVNFTSGTDGNGFTNVSHGFTFIDMVSEEYVPPSPISGNFSINASNAFTDAALTNFSAVVGSDSYNTTSGMIITTILNNDTSLHNITVSADNYYSNITLNYNVTSNLTAELIPHYYLYNITYSDYKTRNAVNYTRNLSYSFFYSCLSGSNGSFIYYMDDVALDSDDLNCSNTTQSYSGNYSFYGEGAKQSIFYFDVDIEPLVNNFWFGNQSFTWDVKNPTLTHNFSYTNGFNNFSTNITLTCQDNITSDLNYTSIFNSVYKIDRNLTNGTLASNTSVLQNGINLLNSSCADYFGDTNASLSRDISAKTLILINELTNKYFNVTGTNITGAKVYFDDNSSSFDFQAQAANWTNFTSDTTDKLRFEIKYTGGAVITRYIDVSLINGSDIRVCANDAGVTHYEQLLLSATQRPVNVKNIFANCYIAADYTRFSYQNSYLLKAFTIDSLYYIYVYDNDLPVYLASIDGSVSTYVNLDTLVFNAGAYDFSVLSDSLTFEQNGTDQILIYYKNLDDDNTALNFSITNMDNSAVVFTTSTFADPNEFTLYFNFATLNVSNTTLFRADLDRTTADGTTRLTKYFNTLAQSGLINSAFAAIISFIFFIFGFTFASTRDTFSWFGIIILIANIGFLGFAITTWYITFLLVINIISLVYTVILMNQKNYPTVS